MGVLPCRIAHAWMCWAARLWTRSAGCGNALRWLRRERGITARELRRWKVGWNGDELVFPLYADGRLVNLKRRIPARGHQMLSWPGVHAFPLFALGRERRIVLCEGELDALRCRSVGIPACSITAGEAVWREEWEAQLAGRDVTVCYDVGSERYARMAVQRLRTLGATADQLGLRGPRGYDLTDYLREHSRTDLERRLGWL